jgi:hypothetical protein
MNVVALTLLALLGSISLALANNECDPAKLLVRDAGTEFVSYYEKLGLTDIYKDDTAKKTKTSVDVPGTGSANSSDEVTRRIEKQFNLQHEESYQFARAYLSLSNAARDAYIACLKSRTDHVFVTPNLGIMDNSDTSVEIELEHFLNELGQAPPRFHGSVVVRGGASLASHQSPTFMIQVGQKITANITRDLDKAFTVIVKVGSEEQTLSIPARTAFHLVRELRYSNNVSLSNHARRGNVEKEVVCVSLADGDDAIFIPGSDAFVTTSLKLADWGRFSETQTSQNSRQICREAATYDIAKNGDPIAAACGFVVAEVIARIPRDQVSSRFAGRPPYVTNDPALACKIIK